MVIDEITVHNFGVYLGKQAIKLTPVSPEKPVILFGGLNGAGKTTLLDALQLSLFGKFAHCSNRGSMAYDDYLKRCIHKSADLKTGAGIEIIFRHVSSGIEHQYNVCRKWHMNTTRINESVSVEKDGKYHAIMSDSWEEYVEHFIPLQISNLFFFDGEKVKELANLKNSADILSTGIHSLLGLNIVDQLATDLVVLERRKKETLKTDEDYQQIEADKAEIQELETLRDDRFQALGSVQNEVDRLKNRLEDLEHKFMLEGGELFNNRDDLEDKRKFLLEQLNKIEEELREVSADSAPLLMVKSMLDSIKKQAAKEELSQQSRLLNKIMLDRDKMLLKTLRSRRFAKKSVDTIEMILSDDRQKRDQAEHCEIYLKLDHEVKESLSYLLKSDLPETETRIRKLLENLHKTRSELEKTDQKLAMIPDEDAVKDLIDEIENTRNLIDAKVNKLNLEKDEYDKLSREVDFKRAKLHKFIDSAVDQYFEQEDVDRVIRHSGQVRQTLDNFRVKLVKRYIERIEQFVLESYKQLFRKKSLIKDIKINPENYSLEITGAKNQRVLPDMLSAGERQLLAVSLLWGLARASGRLLPAIIDTPLGRLDASHRTHLIENYFPYASHQVILLSTDEEISKKYFKKIKPYVGRSYQLYFDESKDATIVQDGYFWKR